MLFNSFAFLLIFLPIALAVSRSLRGNKLLRWITFASFVFYAFAGHIWFLAPMLFTTVLDFYLAQVMVKTLNHRSRRLILVISLLGNLGLLFYFKYTNLIVSAAFPQWSDAFKVILPAGISFYTFQTLSYMIDVYRKEAHAEANFWKFASFVSFFPHLVAGPLTRHNQLIPALEKVAAEGVKARWREGIFLFSLGLCKKVLVADRIANYIDPIIASPEAMTGPTAWIALLGYTMQIYFDFSGYSDMAIGLGRLFGIELPQNFNSPYQAVDPSDFWRRWHMTLSSWLRDYLYFSLGGNRRGEFRRNINLMVTMILGGLWHGANWTFAAWGFYHGLLLVLNHQTKNSWAKLPILFQRGSTFLMITLGWVFFRADNFTIATQWFKALINFPSPALTAEQTQGAAIVLVAIFIVQFFKNASSAKELPSLNNWQQAALGLATAIAIIFMNYSSRFLYFQF